MRWPSTVLPYSAMNDKNNPSPRSPSGVSPIDDRLASDDLLPHPSTTFPEPNATASFVLPGIASKSHLPEPPPLDSKAISKASDSATPIAPLTKEIFASGILPAGTTLNHFVIKSLIGGGGMGRVYLATDTALDRKVAIKVLLRQRAHDPGTVARFINEAKSAARLNHEHIAQVYFTGEQAGIPYIVFEYVEGTNIRAMVNDFDAFPLPQALNYLIQVSHALAHAAEHGVVHRDVKPSNILVTREGRAKLIDMGLARLLDPSESQDDLTASGVTLGTFDYISPEQARDPRNADIRSDIYSLGCTFFYMLAGRPPFPEGTVLQKLLQHQGDEPPDVREFQPNVPSEVAQLIQKMMAKDPRQRFQTPDALIDALVNIAKMLGLQPTGPSKLVWMPSAPTRSSFFLRHIPGVLAMGLLLTVFFFMNLFSEPYDLLAPPPEPATQFATSTTSRELAVNTKNTPANGVSPPAPPTFQVESYAPSRFDLLALSGITSPVGNPTGSDWRRVAFRVGQDRFGRGLGPAQFPTAVACSTREGQQQGASLGVLDLQNAQGLERPGEAISADTRHAEAVRELCVDPSGTIPDSYPTLAEALLDAGNNAIIELRWNNARTIEPIVLSERRIRLVAAEGYYPVLLFKPVEPKSMFVLSDCELEFHDLAVDMRIHPAVLAENWSMFNLTGANRVTIEGCCLTIRNKAFSDNAANHDDVAFFRNGTRVGDSDSVSIPSFVLPSPISYDVDNAIDSIPDGFWNEWGEAVLSTFSKATRLSNDEKNCLTIDIANSVMRGEATVLRCDIPQRAELHVENSFFALAMPFVRTDDTRRTTRQDLPVRLELDRITFFGRQGLVYQMQRSHDTHPIPLEITASHSIFFLNNVPLAVFRGAPSSQGAFDYFKWSGALNYFQNVSSGWRFRADTARSNGGVDYNMDLETWKNAINPEAEADPMRATKIDVLKFEDIRKPTHLLIPPDLRPQFLTEAGVAENEKSLTGADIESLDWMPRSWSSEE